MVLYIVGSVGITLNVGWSEPLDLYNPDDLEASERASQFDVGWFAHPIYISGDYPDVMKWKIGNKSAEQGFAESRLPVFSEEDKTLIKGKCVVLMLSTRIYSRYFAIVYMSHCKLSYGL